MRTRAISEAFPRAARIVRPADYRRLYREGRKAGSKRFVLFGSRNDIGRHRLGITVSRKIGGAVVRNRVKRMFREIFRKSRRDIPGQMDIVINAKKDCAGAGYADLRDEFLAAVRWICRQESCDRKQNRDETPPRPKLG